MKLADILSPDSLRIIRVLAAPPERVWAHLAEAQKRSRWFCAGDDLTGVGQKFELHFGHHRITDEPPPEKYKRFDAAGFRFPWRIARVRAAAAVAIFVV